VWAVRQQFGGIGSFLFFLKAFKRCFVLCCWGILWMKGIVVYDTSYGNTKAVGEAIAEGLKASGLEVDVFYVKDVKKLSGKDYDFLVLGSPTKFGTMSFTFKRFLGKVKDDWVNKPFAAFDTENPENIERSQAENKEWSAAEKIAAKLKEKKMNQLLPVLKALVFDQKGPLKEGEIQRAKDYAKQLAAKLKT
jgi:flavodoxin